MKSLLLIGVMTLFGYGLVAGTAGALPADPAPTPLISTNEGGCWDKCLTCSKDCRDKSGDAKRSCEESCWQTNDTCCKGVGGKGVYKTCGCTDN